MSLKEKFKLQRKIITTGVNDINEQGYMSRPKESRFLMGKNDLSKCDMHNLHLSLVHGTPYYAEPPIPHKKFFRKKQELNLLKLFIGYIIYSLPFVS